MTRLTVDGIYESLWKLLSPSEEEEAKEWMETCLEGNSNLMIFEDKKAVRKWALENTNLVEPRGAK